MPDNNSSAPIAARAWARWLVAVVFSLSAAAALGSDWTYSNEVANAGSRSAGERGVLSFGGSAIRGYPSQQLRTPIGSFWYVESQLLWDPQGWFPIGDIAVKSADLPLAPDALAKGSYRGPKRSGTPEDWCYDPGQDSWLAPSQLTR